MLRNLDPEALELVAGFFAALSVATRLRIMNAMRDGECSVGQLTQAAGCTQANVSKHLAVLAQHGLVAKSPRGTSVYYRIADERVFKLCDLVCGQIAERLSQERARARSISSAVRRVSRG